ncbi:MAG: hypothetical protein Q9165_005023 [Trypethelium subeluteriae]
MAAFFLCVLTSILSILPSHSQACLGHALLKRQAPGLNFTLGDSQPQPLATVGYNLNHFAITVPNFNATMDFYLNALGFRHIFTVPLDDKHSISYIGYPHGGRNATGYQTAEEMNREKNNAEGLIEILYSENASNRSAPDSNFGVGFSHLGFVVPSIEETQTRLDAYNANIIKRVGAPIDENAALYYFGLPKGQFAPPQLQEVGSLFDGFLLALDPSGYLLEFQQQDA